MLNSLGEVIEQIGDITIVDGTHFIANGCAFRSTDPADFEVWARPFHWEGLIEPLLDEYREGWSRGAG